MALFVQPAHATEAVDVLYKPSKGIEFFHPEQVVKVNVSTKLEYRSGNSRDQGILRTVKFMKNFWILSERTSGKAMTSWQSIPLTAA